MMDTTGHVYRGHERFYLGQCLPLRQGDTIVVSWTPAGVFRYHKGRLNLAWGEGSPEPPWTVPPECPLWAVVELGFVNAMSVFDTQLTAL